jgi:perosamine synthetase
VIPLHKVSISGNIDDLGRSIAGVLESGWIGEGPAVKEFELALAQRIAAPNATALNSCTSAIQLALRLAGVEPGDEVITTAMTCAATNMPILLAGAMPVWADICPSTGNISPQSISEKITEKTRAIMVVHWGGYPCDMDSIAEIAARKGIPIIEDAAHALGSTYRDKNIGTHADYVCFSFQAIKAITTGDGGALVCREPAALERARSLKWFGIDRDKRVVNDYNIADWDILEPGYKYQMNDIAATIGLSQLPYLDDVIAQRRHNA